MKKLWVLPLLLAVPVTACSWMGNMTGSRSTQASTAPASSSYVRQAQQKLSDLGLYHGSIDGVDGPDTRNAIRDYQQQHGLTANGMLDQRTDQALMAEGNSPNQNAANPPPASGPDTGVNNGQPSQAQAPDQSPTIGGNPNNPPRNR